MESPFQFGKIVSGLSFTDRVEHLEQLKQNFLSGISTTLISPRRWGKSSLVQKCIEDNFSLNAQYRVVMLDLFKIRTEEEFFQIYAEQLLKSVSSKSGEIIDHAKAFFQRIVPRITISTDSVNDFSFSFDIKELAGNRIEILNLAERIAEKKNLKIIFCIDEFQNIGRYANTEAIQRELRASWQNHSRVIYCLYGSKRQMMRDMFNTSERPFYRFGDVIFLKKIEKRYWNAFIVEAFARTGKKISEEFSGQIAEKMNMHPYYVQQLSHIVWTLTEKTVTAEILEHAEQKIIETNMPFILNEYELLSSGQIHLLKAVCAGETRFNAVEVLQTYKLGTSGNASKNKKTLEARDVIDITPKGIEFIDPVFELWFRGN